MNKFYAALQRHLFYKPRTGFLQHTLRFVQYIMDYTNHDTLPKVKLIKDGDFLFNDYFFNYVIIIETKCNISIQNCIFDNCAVYHVDPNGQLQDGFPSLYI